MGERIGSLSTLAKRSYPAWLFFGGIFLIVWGNDVLGTKTLLLGILFGFFHWLPDLAIRAKQAIREPISQEEMEGDDTKPAEKEFTRRETPDYTEEVKREVYKK